MKNSDYWINRMQILEDSLLDKSYEYVKNLEHQYDMAIRSIEADIAVWYERFAKNNNISLAEAHRLLNTKELDEFKWTVQEYIKYGEENAIGGAWAKQLENASARVHISRLDSLRLQLQQHAEELYGNQLDSLDGLMREVYSESYYHTAFEIQKGVGVGWTFGGIDKRQIEKVLSRPWTLDNQTFSGRIWTNKTSLINSVNTELTQMIMRGDSPDKAIKAIAKRFNVSKSQAGRLVMTESAAFSNAARKDCFNDLDVEKFVIVETLDHTTCPTCGSLDGKVFAMKDYEVGVTAPPFHPWCRGTTAPYFEDMDGYGERFARDENGNSYYVPKDMTYEQWKKTLEKAFTNDEKSATISKNSELSFEEKSAIIRYTSSDGYHINNALRKEEALSPDISAVVTTLDSALSKSPVYKGIIYRVLDMFDEESLLNFIKMNEVGKEVMFSEYLSFSSQKGYNDNGNVFITVESVKAKDIRAFNPTESELLYARNSKFIVCDVYKKDNKYYILWRDINE